MLQNYKREFLNDLNNIHNLHNEGSLNQENYRSQAKELNTKLEHINFLEKIEIIFKKQGFKAINCIINADSFKITFENSSGLRKDAILDNKTYMLLHNNITQYKTFDKNSFLKVIDHKDSNNTLLYLIPPIALVFMLFNATDNSKTIKNNESSYVEDICKDAIVSYVGTKKYSSDDLIYLERQKINNTQENEIGVQFQDISSGKVITTVYIKNKNRCDVVNQNSSHIY